MTEKYSVSLEKVVRDNGFEILYTPKEPADIYITCCDVNRPGLILAQDDNYFDPVPRSVGVRIFKEPVPR